MTTPNTRSPSLADVIRVALDRRLMDTYVSMPGIVHSYDPATQTASVQPALRKLAPDPSGIDKVVQLPVLQRVPVVFPGSGSWRITCPVEEGDTVLLLWSDRSINVWKSTGLEGDPLVPSQHAIADAIAIVGLVPPGKARVALATDRISIGSAGGAVVDVLDDEVRLGAASASHPVPLGDNLTQAIAFCIDATQLLCVGPLAAIKTPLAGLVTALGFTPGFSVAGAPASPILSTVVKTE